ncbi:MAG: hypothetical protein R3B09_12060 [Nannocystaceae bacterium]
MSAPVGAFAGFWSRLSPRERNLITALVVVFFVVGVGVLFMMRSDSFTASEERINDLRRGIQLTQTRGVAYQERKEEKSRRESMISSDPVVFTVLLEEASKAALEDKTTRQEEEKPAIELGGRLIKRLISFELRSVSMEELIKFIQALENQAGHVVLTERLKIRSPSAVEDRLNVEVDLATYEMSADTAAEEESAP